MPLVETSPFAPFGELLTVDGGERVVCHLCGRALTMLGATHLRQHGWTAALYREAFGLRRGASLCAPAMTERRRLLGLERYESNRELREGLAIGQALARSGRLLELSHQAQPAGSARAETRRRAGSGQPPFASGPPRRRSRGWTPAWSSSASAKIWRATCAMATGAGACPCWRWHVSWAWATAGSRGSWTLLV
jgi:bifunctional DNA-binding transcriptional regulator/antitoxin component of YhaV-PrlF toxin-antitoxin module